MEIFLPSSSFTRSEPETMNGRKTTSACIPRFKSSHVIFSASPGRVGPRSAGGRWPAGGAFDGASAGREGSVAAVLACDDSELLGPPSTVGLSAASADVAYVESVTSGIATGRDTGLAADS